MKFRILIVLGCMFMSWPALTEPMKFKSWKEQQILGAQNELLRISAKLHAPKAKSEATRAKSELDGTNRFEKAGDVTDRDVKSAQESLEIAKNLTLEDYAEVYVAHLQDNPDQFAKLVDTLSKDELVQLVKILNKIRSEEPSDPKKSLTDGLSLSSHS